MLLTHPEDGPKLIKALADANPAFDTLFFLNRSFYTNTSGEYYDEVKASYLGASYTIQIYYYYGAGNEKMFDLIEVFNESYQKLASASYINIPVSAGSLLYLDDKLYLTGADDNVYDGGGNDLVDLSDGDDIYHYLSGNDQVLGGNGWDVVTMDVPHGDVLSARTGSSYKLTVGTEAIVTVSAVERVEFKDGATLAFDLGAWTNAGGAYRLYQAAFDRVPDAGGLKFWIDAIDDGEGDLLWAATSFIASAEFQDTYGTPGTVSDAAFVDLLYQNVLDRPAEGAGATYWMDELAAGADRAQVLLSFSESQENQNRVASAIDDGIWF